MAFTKQGLFAKKPVSVLLEQAAEDGIHTLKRGLGWPSLTMLGIGGVIGGGIFVLTGQQAAINAGPAIVLSFVLAGIVCVFAALCYAELAAMIPVSGSAYTYTYATLGEFIAWIIAWDLIIEYGLASAAVSAGWAGHFNDMLKGFGMGLPHALSSAPYTFDGSHLVATGSILNVPAMAIVCLMGAVLISGITHSAIVNNLIVSFKVLVVVACIAIGLTHVHPELWHPFIPARIPAGVVDADAHFGWSGILTAAGVIFFAYIGFEAVSTAAQEAKNPAKNMPIGILLSLGICTVLYLLMALTITGLAPYASLNSEAPVAIALGNIPGMHWLRQTVNIAVAIGLGSTILSLLYGQSRIFFSMSRDGLLPPMFGRINPKTRTPIWGTVITSLIAGLVGGLFPIKVLGELVSMGTLLAFALICGGVMYLRVKEPNLARGFKAPMVWVTAPLGIAGCLFLIAGLPTPTWLRLVIWMAIGLVIYFGYAYNHSRVHNAAGGK
ncbi:MAG: amino acid/polyamine/organocation transporter, superfamily [Caulobacteraceae bacterium]|nr:amino acid/polyamine/organocation transporter, superfamily [Caulobacteraceae bacterium]